jgi:hypothetical protein
VATLIGNVSNGDITASGAFASTDYVIHSGGPTDSQLTISSCTATSTRNADLNCERAYDGVSSYYDGSWLTQVPAPADSAITITLSNVSAQPLGLATAAEHPFDITPQAQTITRFEIDQQTDQLMVASRVIIEYFEGPAVARASRLSNLVGGAVCGERRILDIPTRAGCIVHKAHVEWQPSQSWHNIA